MTKILIIEDEKKLLNSLSQGLTEEGYHVLTAQNGEEGFFLATKESIDALILDIMLPKRDGLEVLSELRRSGFIAPVLMLTARDKVEDRVAGLDTGADDYLVKPYAFAELLARLRALLRRNFQARNFTMQVGDIELNSISRRVVLAGVELEFSPREYHLLEYLMRHVNQSVTREMIANEVWKESGTVLTNIIDVYINYLRKKLEQPGKPQVIHTIRGVGYCLRDES
ncbi:DNA-binding heavy metal response regulator [hydrothermal vent metagenome]|uniref:DNA-binding heavy metal response regulator n=1 Tax=hydrothermal vent metagenome TaxID=652676 RepID=A0A3B1DZ24_9ZZZZ